MIINGKNFKQIVVAGLFPLVVFFIHVGISRGTSLYDTTWWTDVIMHYLGGIAIAAFIYLIVCSSLGVHLLGRLRPLALWIMCIGLVALATVFWEFVEWSADALFKVGSQRSVDDTMLDIFMGLLGGVSALLFFSKKVKYGSITDEARQA